MTEIEITNAITKYAAEAWAEAALKSCFGDLSDVSGAQGYFAPLHIMRDVVERLTEDSLRRLSRTMAGKLAQVIGQGAQVSTPHVERMPDDDIALKFAMKVFARPSVAA